MLLEPTGLATAADRAVSGHLVLLRRATQTAVMTTEPDEQQAMEHVAARLMERYPEVTRERVDAVVDEEHHRYDGRPVRDFVPVLVERAAKDRLGQEATASTPDRGTDGRGEQDRSDPPEIDPMERERQKDRHSGFLFGDLGGGPS